MGVNFAKDIATKLNTSTTLTLGTNLFYNTKLPDNDALPDRLVVVYNGLPKKPNRCFGLNTEQVYKRATIIIRSDINGSYETIEALGEEIYAALQSFSNTTWQDIYFKFGGFGQEMIDEQNRYIWSSEVEGWYNRTPTSNIFLKTSGDEFFKTIDDELFVVAGAV